jgi:lipopolysaccharide export system protein LptC
MIQYLLVLLIIVMAYFYYTRSENFDENTYLNKNPFKVDYVNRFAYLLSYDINK